MHSPLKDITHLSRASIIMFTSKLLTVLLLFGLASCNAALIVRDPNTAGALAECSTYQGCSKCVADAKCGFNKSTFKCENRKTTGQVTTAVGCPLMNQMQGLFPAAGGQPAGIPPANVKAEWQRIKNHVFNGEAGSSTSGRHLKSTWLAANPKSKVTSSNPAINLLQYDSSKTVWDDSANFYDRTDVENMCYVSLALRIRDKEAIKAYVVQTPFAKPACIETFTAGTGSCYPRGVTSPEKLKLNEPCLT